MTRIAFFGPWVGEFGWELMSWQAWCRAESKKYNKCYVCSFRDMKPLYQDFAEFIPHEYHKRNTDPDDISDVEFEIPPDVTDHIKPFKDYYTGGEFIKFGKPGLVEYPILIHARGISKSASRNYPRKKWQKLIEKFDCPIASIGTMQDRHIAGTVDMRALPLQELMDLIASTKLVIGGSSGVMHLTSLCGTPHVAWGNRLTYFWETLAKRYKQTWNPLRTPCEFIYNNRWQPSPRTIAKYARRLLNDTSEGDNTAITTMDAAIQAANKSGCWMTTISYIQNEKVVCVWRASNYPKDRLLSSLQQLGTDMVKTDPTIMQGAATLYGAQTWH